MLQFRDTVELEERGETVIYVVTEPVTPLAVHLAGLDLQGPQRSQYIAMGIYHCAKALSFLNNDCKLVSGAARSQIRCVKWYSTKAPVGRCRGLLPTYRLGGEISAARCWLN